MPRLSNTVCFMNGSWTAAIPPSNRFLQDVSPTEQEATAGLLDCTDCPDWERNPAIAIHIRGGNAIQSQLAFPIELRALLLLLLLLLTFSIYQGG